MKLLLLFVACCVAYASAQQECTPLARMKVKTQWVQAYSTNAVARELFGREVWIYLLRNYPKVMEFLTRVRGDNVYSPEFEAHAVRVFGGLDICISLLNDDATLTAQLNHLRDQHDERGIPHEFFDYFLEALQYAIPIHADNYDQDAWTACYGVIRDGITKDLSDE